jgi:TonB family protein
MKSNLAFCLFFSPFVLFSQTKELESSVAIVDVVSINTDELPDVEAEFPGGMVAMTNYMKENVRYPQYSIEINEQGRVFLSFIVDKYGSISDVKVEKGVSDSLNVEAIRVVRSMPKWKPALLADQPVKSTVRLPINFTLDGGKKYDDIEDDDVEERKSYDGHWAGFDFGTLILMSDLFKTDFATNDYWKNNVARSSVFNFNFFDYKIPIFKQNLGLTTGLGWTISTIGLNQNYDISYTADTIFAVANVSQNYRANTLNVQYITIPLLLEFATKKEQKKSFYFAAGVIGGVRVFSNTRKTGRYTNGDRFDLNVRSKYNFAPFSLEATIRTGYGPIGLFATYNLNTLFKEGKTVAIYPFRTGITINIDYGK